MSTQTTALLSSSIMSAVAGLIPEGYKINFAIVKDDEKFNPQSNPVLAKSIQTLVCRYFGITPELITSRDRREETVLARKMLCLMLRKYTTVNLSDLSEYAFAKRDHSQVINSTKTLYKWMKVDSDLKQKVEDLELFIISNIKF